MGFRINVKSDIDLAKITSRLDRANEILANEAMKDTDKFVPKLTGTLSGGTRVVDGQIIYPGPYARYLYHGKLMVDPETGSSYARKGSTKTLTGKSINVAKSNPMAQPEWFEVSKGMNLEKWKRVFAKAVTNG